MENLNALNNKKVKKLTHELNEQFGFSGSLKDYAVFVRKKDSSIKVITKDVEKIMDKRLNIDSLGLRIGKEITDGILLTIEGTQLIGQECNKNIIELNEEECRLWLRGFDLQKDGLNGQFAILKNKNNDFLGSAKVKKGLIINNISKTRRIKSKD
ncbi:MAG: hypothetical protein ACOCZ6_03080 [Nanoarchaeota archaeon]